MTYGAVHGQPVYSDGQYDIGSPQFFAHVDSEFFRWNAPLHHTRPFDRLFPYGKYSSASRVLEVGCGLGTMAMCWARSGVKMTAVDLNRRAVEMTKKRFDLAEMHADIVQVDVRSLPFSDSQFDYVYSWGVLHHSPQLERSLAELLRVLKPGGGYGLMLYDRQSIRYRYLIQYIEGFLHYEDRFLNAVELASRYGDADREEGNPHTWPGAAAEVKKILTPHADHVRIKRFGVDLDMVFRDLLPLVGRRLPTFSVKPWARRFGWSLWAEGSKTLAA